MNAGGGFGKKAIYLAGQELAKVPPNTGGLSVWQEKLVPLALEQLSLVGRENEVWLDNDGDYYKVRRLALAVQLRDGTWVRTGIAEGVHHSVTKWRYAEGTPFENGRSRTIVLGF